MIPNVPPPTGMSACSCFTGEYCGKHPITSRPENRVLRQTPCACDSMGTCLAHELSPNRCNCGISWASPTPRPVCPDHGHHRDVELLTLRFLPSEVM